MNEKEFWFFIYRILLAVAEMIRKTRLEGIRVKQKCSITLEFPSDK